MLRGSLRALGGAEALLASVGIEGARRAETLTIAEFDRLARALLARDGQAPPPLTAATPAAPTG
jgi:16S rRNA (adenine1518-N6/adenine1519-N6)-dimethyltransferase